MKKLIVFVFLISSFNLAYGQEKNSTVYGEDFKVENIISVNEIPLLMNNLDSMSGTFRGVIESSCKMKGCWMTVKAQTGDPIRITFKDYGFFVPKEGLTGKKAIFRGNCLRSTASIAELKHYAQDAGKSKEEIALIIAPKDEFRFVAYGVKIEE